MAYTDTFLADANYPAGTVVVYGGANEVTTSSLFGDTTVAGVIASSAGTQATVVLKGRTTVMVMGPVNQGDLLVVADNAGLAKSLQTYNTLALSFTIDMANSVFAKSLVTDAGTGARMIPAVVL